MNQVTIHYNAPHQTELNTAVHHYTTLHDTALHHFHHTVLYHIVLHCSAVHCTTLYYTIYNTIFYLHCTALPCTALHCAPLRPTSLICKLEHAGPFSHLWLLIFSSWITSVLYCTLPDNGVLWEPQKMYQQNDIWNIMTALSRNKLCYL